MAKARLIVGVLYLVHGRIVRLPPPTPTLGTMNPAVNALPMSLIADLYATPSKPVTLVARVYGKGIYIRPWPRLPPTDELNLIRAAVCCGSCPAPPVQNEAIDMSLSIDGGSPGFVSDSFAPIISASLLTAFLIVAGNASVVIWLKSAVLFHDTPGTALRADIHLSMTATCNPRLKYTLNLTTSRPVKFTDIVSLLRDRDWPRRKFTHQSDAVLVGESLPDIVHVNRLKGEVEGSRTKYELVRIVNRCFKDSPDIRARW